QTTFRVVITGSASVAATPPGPGQGPFHAPRRKPDEPCEQMAHFRNGQGKRRRSRRRPRGHRRGSGATGEDTNPCKVRKSQQDERDVYVIRNRSEANYSRITYIIRTETEGSIPNNAGTNQ